ncbi:MAG: hypothetical protein FWG05_03260 [Kiritimatiellaeota bacterium]|nr:hypothetical protein [Kiritimatiellota bacterium]
MIRRIAALCRLGFRAPFSSRFVWALMCVLALVVILLPMSIEVKGTSPEEVGAGQVRMILTWTFGLAFVVLAAATMWSGCAALSSDIEEGRHTGAAVSPARPFEIWLGRWLGLVLANAVVLVVVAGGIYAQLNLRGLTAKDDGGGRRTDVTRRLDISRESLMGTARDYYRQALELGAVPVGATEAEVIESILNDLTKELMPIEPGQKREWEFILRKGDERKNVSVTFSCVSSLGSTFGCKGEISVYDGREAGEPRLILTHTIGENDAGKAEFEIPAGSLAGGRFSVVYSNAGGEDGVSALVRHNESMIAGVGGGGVVRNLALCAAILLTLLSALAGIGVSLGAMFSFPVAAFTGAAVVFTAFVVSGGAEDDALDFGHSHGGDAEHSRVIEAFVDFSVRASRVVASANKPFIEANAFDRLGDGVLIDARMVWASAARTGAGLPLAFGVLAALALRRREL